MTDNEPKGERERDPEKISAATGNGVSTTHSAGSETKRWFDDKKAVLYWAREGREACKRLRLDPDEHGV